MYSLGSAKWSGIFQSVSSFGTHILLCMVHHKILDGVVPVSSYM